MMVILRHWRVLLFSGLMLLVFVLSKLTLSYRDKYLSVSGEMSKQQTVIAQMQQSQYAVAELDAKYTRELSDAKQTIERLRHDVSAGRRRLYVNATCDRVPEATSAPGVDDGIAARFTPDAERAYWRLREQIETSDKQIKGLQSYIREQCFK